MPEQDVAMRPAITARSQARPEAVAAASFVEGRRRQGRRDALAGFVVTGGLAGAALALTLALGLLPWVLFLAWVGYGLIGRTAADAGRLLAAFAVGAAAGMATALVGEAARPWLDQFAMPLALALSCGALAMLERRPPSGLAPACFLGMTAFFASGGPPSAALFGALAAPAALGVAWGWAAPRLQAALERRLGAG